MKITIQGFTGALPRQEPRYLPDAAATVATKVRLDRGHLSPMMGNATYGTTVSAAKSFYVAPPAMLIPTLFFTETDVDVVAAPIAAKTLYVTGIAPKPQKYVGGVYSDLPLPAPVSAPTTSITAGVLDTNTAEDTVFAYTLLRDGTEESAPSPVSAPLLTSPNQTVLVSGMPTGNAKRIYRSKTSFSGATELFFIAEIPSATTSYSHTLSTTPLQEAIPSTDYDPPPGNLRGITSMPNGIIVGFADRELCFSEPFVPHAWPEKYRISLVDPIVGIVSFGTSIAVLTEGYPYIVQGLHPDSMVATRMESTAPCVAKMGIVDVGYAAIYPSTDGLIQISQAGVQNLTETIFTRSQWQALNPSTIIAAQYKGGYAFLHDDGSFLPPFSKRLAFITIDGGSPSYVRNDGTYFRYVRFDPYTGKLLALTSNGLTVLSLDDDAGLPGELTWKSKPFRVPGPIPMGVLYVDAEPPASGTPSFTCNVYADGVDVAPTVVAPNKIERLRPPSTPAQVWEVEVITNYTVTRIIICGEPDEVFQ